MLGSLGFGGRGIGRPSVVNGAGALVPPDFANIAHWYDFTDLSTLWQDTSATTPVASNNDPVARVDDKVGGVNILQDTANAEPLYKESPAGVRSQLNNDFFDDNTASAFASGNFTVAVCWIWRAVSTTSYVWTWQQLDAWVQQASSGSVNVRMANTFVGASTPVGYTGEPVAVWQYDDGANAQRGRGSWETSDFTSAGTSLGPTASDNLAIMNYSGTGSNAYSSEIKEWIAWSGALSSGDRAALQTYFASKHGVVWE